MLLLTQDLNVWGAQRQIIELAKGLDPRRYDVRLGALEPDGPLRSEVEALAIPLVTFPRRWRWDLSPITRLARYLREEAIDIVHSFLFLPNFYARFAGKLARTPAIVSSLRSTGIEGWPRYAMDVATCFMCDVMIANSAAGRDHYVRRGGLASRIVVVRNGLSLRPDQETNATNALPETVKRFEHLVGMIGALEWRKDQQLLIRSLVPVLQSKPRTGLVLAGDGANRPDLERLVVSLGLASHVVFLGTVSCPRLLYPLLDVYVQASLDGEGVSNSILEAMAHSRPVIATDVGGNGEVVEHGRTGLIVPAGDATALAKALLSLLSDSEQRERMGRFGLERVRTVFSLEAMITATCSVYGGILHRRAAERTATPATWSIRTQPSEDHLRKETGGRSLARVD